MRIGRTRTAAAVLVISALTLVPAASCGSGDEESSVRGTMEDLSAAIADREFDTVCDAYLSDGFRDRLSRLGGCASGAARVIRKPGRIERIRVRGEEAMVTLAGSRALATLVREREEWRVDSLTSASGDSG